MNVDTRLVLLNAVYVGAGQPLERILDVRQADPAAPRGALPQTTQRGEQFTFVPEPRLGAFTSCLRYATHFAASAPDLNPAAPWQVELYAVDLHYYTAASDAHHQRVEAPPRKFEMRFQTEAKTTKDLDGRGVAWCPNEIWFNISVVECVLSKDPGNMFGYERLGFRAEVPYGELSSDDSGFDTSTTATASGTTATAPQPQVKAPEGKSATKVATSVKPGLVVAARVRAS